tara:strand:- start:668 stop:793 length:126 start_codon:yes stop_codon:yes gene_type:complete
MEISIIFAILALFASVVTGCLLQATGFPQWLFKKLPWVKKG